MTDRRSYPEFDRAPSRLPKPNGAFTWGIALLCFGWLTVSAIAIALIVWGGK